MQSKCGYTFLTLFGKVVVRLLAESQQFQQLSGLTGFGCRCQTGPAAQATNGTLIVAGPAGSGKTTTLYACLREIVDKLRVNAVRSVLEDPIEAVIPGVSQSQINLAAGFDLPTGRSLMRQDPSHWRRRNPRSRDCRDRLSGGPDRPPGADDVSCGRRRVISRLSEMEIEPYLPQRHPGGGLSKAGSQTLQLQPAWHDADKLGLPDDTFRVAVGCEHCSRDRLSGKNRAGILSPITEIGRAILSRNDTYN